MGCLVVQLRYMYERSLLYCLHYRQHILYTFYYLFLTENRRLYAMVMYSLGLRARARMITLYIHRKLTQIYDLHIIKVSELVNDKHYYTCALLCFRFFFFFYNHVRV